LAASSARSPAISARRLRLGCSTA